MNLFEDGDEFELNDDGDVVFKGNNTTYLGMLKKGMTLNSVLYLEACNLQKLHSNSPAIETIPSHPMLTTQSKTTSSMHDVRTFNKIKSRSKSGRKSKVQTSAKHRAFNKLHKVRQRSIQQERVRIQLLNNNFESYKCGACDNHTCNYMYRGDLKQENIICQDCANFEMEKDRLADQIDDMSESTFDWSDPSPDDYDGYPLTAYDNF